MLFRSSRVVRSLSFATHLHFHLKRRPIKAMSRAYCRSVGFGAELASEGDEPPEMKVRGITFRWSAFETSTANALRVLQFYCYCMCTACCASRTRFSPDERILTLLRATKRPWRNVVVHLQAHPLRSTLRRFPQNFIDSVTRISQMWHETVYTYVRHNNIVAESHVNGLNDLSYNKKFSTRFSLLSR